MSGLIRKDILGFLFISSKIFNSYSDSTFIEKMFASHASMSSLLLLPTPEKTILLGSAPI